MLKTAEKVVDASLQLKTAKESLAKIQSQLFHKNIIKRKTLFVKSKKTCTPINLH